MGLETATYISELNGSWPVGGVDDYATADDHLRLIKDVLQAQFSGLTAGAVLASQAELNILDGALVSTAELNILNGALLSTAELNILNGATLSTTELNKLTGLTSSTVELNKLTGFTGIAGDLNVMTGAAAAGLTPAEMAFLNGVTSNIQTQFTGKVTTARLVNAGAGMTGGGALTGDVTLNAIGGLGITVNANDIQLDFAHDRNVAHAGVSVITAAAGLAAVNDNLSSNIGLSLNIASLADLGATVAADLDVDTVAMNDAGTPKEALVGSLLTPELGPTISGAANTLAEDDFGKMVPYSNTGAVAVTLPNGLKQGFWSMARKTAATGTITFSATTTLETANSLTGLSIQYGLVTVFHLGSNVWTAWGDLG